MPPATGRARRILGVPWLAFGPVLGSVFVVLLLRVRSSWRDANTRLLLCSRCRLWRSSRCRAARSGANANWRARFRAGPRSPPSLALARGRQRLLVAASR
jgi:hypothetical protein